MYYKLIRDTPNGKAVPGRLCRVHTYCNKRLGKTCERLYPICDTLENADFLVPALIYRIAVTQSPKFKRLFPEYRDKEVFVAVAALNYDRDAIHYAKEQGLLVISTADGDNFTLQPADCKTLKRF